MASNTVIQVRPVLQQYNKDALVKHKEHLLLHKTGLTKALIKHFQPRPIPNFFPPEEKKPQKQPYTGVGDIIQLFEDPQDQESQEQKEKQRPEKRKFNNKEFPYQAYVEDESKREKKERIAQIKVQQAEQEVEEGVSKWDPQKDPNIEGDPYKTLFVARVSYDLTEKKIKKEFDRYGPVKRVRMVMDRVNLDKQGRPKPRGYAFVEFEHKADMREAYKRADGTKLENRRILVDAERGRTVENWRPRRLGGGKGGETRRPVEKVRIEERPELLTQIPESIITTIKPDQGKSRDRHRDRSHAEKDRPRDKEKDRERRREKDKEKERGEKDRGEKDKDRARDKEKKDREKDRGERESKRQKREDNLGVEDGTNGDLKMKKDDLELQPEDKQKSAKRSDKKEKNREKDDRKDKKDKDKKERKEKHKDRDREKDRLKLENKQDSIQSEGQYSQDQNDIKMEDAQNQAPQNGLKEEFNDGEIKMERRESKKRSREKVDEWLEYLQEYVRYDYQGHYQGRGAGYE